MTRYRIDRDGNGQFRVMQKGWLFWRPIPWTAWDRLLERKKQIHIWSTCSAARASIAALHEKERAALAAHRWQKDVCPLTGGHEMSAEAAAKICHAAGVTPPCCNSITDDHVGGGY